MSVGAQAASVLRETLAADPEALRRVLSAYFPCNQTVETDSPAVPTLGEDGRLYLGPLGLINGIVNRISPGGRVVAHFDAQGVPVDFTYEPLSGNS